LVLPEGLRITECTAVAVLPEHTATADTLLAQNWDWHPTQQPYTIVLATRDERGHEIVTLAEAGMLAKSGLNSAGVGVCVNLLHSDRDGGTGGVPYHVLIRDVLDQPDGISISLRVTALPRSASINLLVGVAGGTAVDLELAPGAVGRILPQDGILTHANHFVSGIDVVDAIYDIGGSSLFRDHRLRQLLTGAAADRKVLVDDVIAGLQDHLGFPYAICRHVNDADPADLQSLSAASVVMNLDERELLISSGPPCESPYQRINLATVFDEGNAAAERAIS
jgi:isopenicillin-N N-acyltransferase-like protein